jgi:hypothetical protein
MNHDDRAPSGRLAVGEYRCVLCGAIDRWDAMDAEATQPDYCASCEDCLWVIADDIKALEVQMDRAATIDDLKRLLEKA